MKYKASIYLVIFCLFIVILPGCYPTTKRTVPNTSIIDNRYVPRETPVQAIRVKSLLSDLATYNSLLGSELGKIPELHDDITTNEINALEKVINVYNENPKNFDNAFVTMNKVGIPKVRKYCVPLQAIFWLAEQNRIEDIKFQLLFYSKRTTGPVIIPQYSPSIRGWDFSDESKWGNPQEIMDRLNSPELFEYWFRHNFTYDMDKFREYLHRSDGYPQSAERTIKTKKGICFDAAYVAYVCLKRAGYEITGLNVYFSIKSGSGASVHCVCLVKMIDPKLKGIMQVKRFFVIADTVRPGYIAGPFDSMRKAAQYVARLCGVGLKMYTTGLPSYQSQFLR